MTQAAWEARAEFIHTQVKRATTNMLAGDLVDRLAWKVAIFAAERWEELYGEFKLTK